MRSVAKASRRARTAAGSPMTNATTGSVCWRCSERSRSVTDLPLIAAGGLMDGRDVAAVLAGGAEAAQLGTAFLRSPESAANDTYKAALTDGQFELTAITRAFSGRRARGLVNRFMLEHPSAPAAYPQINSATRPLRADAARRSDPHGMSLWAGQGYQRAEARSAGEIVDDIAATLHHVTGDA